MEEAKSKVDGYRWIILLVYSIIQAVMQMLWITFAPITGDAAAYYQVTPLQIGFLAMSFMIVYIFISLPASWAIDTMGIRKGVGFGVILTGIFGITRGLFGSSYTFVMMSMIGLALAQPFILNSITALSAKWFPIEERATAAGLAVMAQFVGIIVGMAATPFRIVRGREVALEVDVNGPSEVGPCVTLARSLTGPRVQEYRVIRKGSERFGPDERA